MCDWNWSLADVLKCLVSVLYFILGCVFGLLMSLFYLIHLVRAWRAVGQPNAVILRRALGSYLLGLGWLVFLGCLLGNQFTLDSALFPVHRRRQKMGTREARSAKIQAAARVAAGAQIVLLLPPVSPETLTGGGK